MILKDCRRKCRCCDDDRPNLPRLFFWFAILPSIGALLFVYFCSVSFYGSWSAIYTLNTVFFINSVWFDLLCPAGFFLLHFRVINKALATLYSVGLSSVIICCAACILMSQFRHANLEDSDNFVVQSIKEYFTENEDIPVWMQQIQQDKKCCGFSGPRDWKQFIYPVDKPAVEDVPLSCCIVKASGCNLILGELMVSTNTTDTANLAKWIHVNGCKKSVQSLLDGVLCYVAYGAIALIIAAILVLSLYWWQLVELMREEALVAEILQDLERRGSGTSTISYGGRRTKSRRGRGGSGSPSRKRSVAVFNDDDDGVGDLFNADTISEYSGGHRSPI